MLSDDLFEGVPNFRAHLVDHSFSGFDVAGVSALDKSFHHEGLEEFESHLFRQSALMKFQVGAHDDD